MISEVYKKAVELIRKELFPIEHEDDLEKAVSVFKLLIKEGHYVGPDDIYQYLIDYGNDREIEGLASKTQQIYEVVKATLNTKFGWKEDWLRKELLDD